MAAEKSIFVTQIFFASRSALGAPQALYDEYMPCDRYDHCSTIVTVEVTVTNGYDCYC